MSLTNLSFKFAVSLVVILCWVVPEVLGVFQNCTYPTFSFRPERSVRRYGKPTPFVTTRSAGIDKYALVDPFRQSGVYHEYLMLGSGYEDSVSATGVHQPEDDEYAHITKEDIQLVLFDQNDVHVGDTDPNLVVHNLKKEYFWAMTNATGMLPSLTVANTTFERTFRFTTVEGDRIAYHLSFPNIFRSSETVPPVDVLIEFPAKTRTLRTLKTMIDYQTVPLLRWKLTNADPVSWKDLNEQYEFSTALSFSKPCDEIVAENEDALGRGEAMSEVYLPCIYQQRMKRFPNPCIEDMFMVYTIRGKKPEPGKPETYTSVNHLLITIPMVYDALGHHGFYDLTEAYCPYHRTLEECGNPQDIVLTNEHLLILTDKGLTVSNRLTLSQANVSMPYSLKPFLKFTQIDPCSLLETQNCTHVGIATLIQHTVRKQRLFYTHVCHVFQQPLYEDLVMLVIEHVSQAPDKSRELDVFTVLYAVQPYNNWKMLFGRQFQYRTSEAMLPIKALTGIFYNHHRRHFDISLVLDDLGVERAVRFILPRLDDKNATGYQELSGLLGHGFLEFEFPPTFHMTHISVNPTPMDIFFLGNQVAEVRLLASISIHLIFIFSSTSTTCKVRIICVGFFKDLDC